MPTRTFVFCKLKSLSIEGRGRHGMCLICSSTCGRFQAPRGTGSPNPGWNAKLDSFQQGWLMHQVANTMQPLWWGDGSSFSARLQEKLCWRSVETLWVVWEAGFFTVFPAITVCFVSAETRPAVVWLQVVLSHPDREWTEGHSVLFVTRCV